MRNGGKKIGIIGHFGGKEEYLEGQTIKTKNLKKLLEEYAGFKTYCVDTHLNKKNKLLLLLKSIICLLKCKNLFILLSENGMRFYLPFLYRLNKIFRRRIFHYIIGSAILRMVEEDKRFVKYLNSLKVNWFEYQSGVDRLKDNGVRNVELLSNCKVLNAIDKNAAGDYKIEDTIRFCTFSRVIPEKGIKEAILAVSEINKRQGRVVANLDIYGQVGENYKQEFECLLDKYGDCASYKGKVDSTKSVEVLKDYFALLFPTRWPGEGFSAAYLDAFASGLPVIASDWNANKEILSHGKTGILFPSKEFTDLEDAVRWAVENPQKIIDMRKYCRDEYDKYTPEIVCERIINVICNGECD